MSELIETNVEAIAIEPTIELAPQQDLVIEVLDEKRDDSEVAVQVESDF